MTAPRFFTDEDVYGAVAAALRRYGFDAVSASEAGRLGETDESQLDWSAAEGRALITFNVGHFAALHATWLGQGRSHPGVVLSSQRPIGDLVRRVLHLAHTLDADTLCDRIEFLTDW